MRDLIETIERMSYSVLLTESARIDFLLKTYGPKIEAKIASEQAPADITAAIQQQPGDSEAAKVVSFIMGNDPSRNQQYTQWLLTRWLKGLARLEDMGMVHDDLELFMRARSQITQKDINQYRTFGDLGQAVERFREKEAVTSNRSEEQALARRMHQDDHANILLNTDRIKIVTPVTKDAACYFGRNTRWCTAADNNNRFHDYHKDGPLYIILLKATNTRYQYHSESKQFMDERDRSLSSADLKALLHEYPEILKAIPRKKLFSHVRELGLSFFTLDDLKTQNTSEVVDGITSKQDFNHVVLLMQEDPYLLARFLLVRPQQREWVPKELVTDSVVQKLREELKHVDKANPSNSVFVDLDIPVREWPASAVAWAINNGKISYNQLNQLPDEVRTTKLMNEFIRFSAVHNPKHIADIPEQVLRDLSNDSDSESRGAGPDALIQYIVGLNAKTLEYLPESMLTDEVLDELGQQFGALRSVDNLAYLPPERLTPQVIANLERATNVPDYFRGADPQEKLRSIWVDKVMRADPKTEWGSRRVSGMVAALRQVPDRYLTPDFFDAAYERRERYRWRDEGWLAGFIDALIDMKMPTSPALLAKAISTAKDQHAAKHLFDSFAKKLGVSNIPSEVWESAIKRDAVGLAGVKMGLETGAIQLTPGIAAVLYEKDPVRFQHMAHEIDDSTLSAILKREHYYNQKALFGNLPKERITEPVAHAAAERGHGVSKAQIPPKARSKRVYLAGVGRVFRLKDVPPRWRDDTMMAVAVSRRPVEIKSVAEPLALLNNPSFGFATKEDWWQTQMEEEGYTQHDGKFVHVTDLPHTQLDDGWMISVSKRKTEKRLFLSKPGTPALVFAIRRNKVQIVNLQHLIKDKTIYTKPLRQVAERYLEGVDIANLNPFNVYADKEGVRGEEDAPRKEVEGIEWSKTDYKTSGRKETAWIDGKPVLSVIFKGYGWRGKVSQTEVHDFKMAREYVQPLMHSMKAHLGTGYMSQMRYTLTGIGIHVDREGRRASLLMERKLGSILGLDVWWSPSLRMITVYDPKAEGIVGEANILKSGKIGNTFEVYAWKLPGKTSAEKDEQVKTVKKAITELSGVFQQKKAA